MKNATTWQLDPAHTTIEFAVKHMMFTTVRGRFNEGEGAPLAGATSDATRTTS